MNQTEHLQTIHERRVATDMAYARANRKALLEHARMGRSISTWRDGQVVWIPPAEVFAMYGLDEFGRPQSTQPITITPTGV